MISLPPLFAGALKEMVSLPSLATVPAITGASAGAVGAPLAALLAGPTPCALTARICTA